MDDMVESNDVLYSPNEKPDHTVRERGEGGRRERERGEKGERGGGERKSR